MKFLCVIFFLNLMVCFSTMNLVDENSLSLSKRCGKGPRDPGISTKLSTSDHCWVVEQPSNIKVFGGHISDLNHTSCCTIESEMEGSGYN